MSKRWLSIGLPVVAVVGVGLVVGDGWLRSDRLTPPSDPPPSRAAEGESLAAQTDRLFRRDVLPDLLAELARVLPPDNPPELVRVWTAGPRVECEFGTYDGVWTRSTGSGDGWEKVSDLPAEDWSKYERTHMAVAGGRVYYSGQHRASGEAVVWSRSLGDPEAAWRRDPAPVHPRVFTGSGDWLYGMALDRKLVRRAGADPAAAWEEIGRVPDTAGGLFAVGDQLWWFDPTAGPVLARPAAGTDEPWQMIGRVRPPTR